MERSYLSEYHARLWKECKSFKSCVMLMSPLLGQDLSLEALLKGCLDPFGVALFILRR